MKQDNPPRILIVGPDVEWVLRLQAELMQGGLVTDTLYETHGQGFGKAAHFQFVVAMYLCQGRETRRRIRTLVISPNAQAESTVHVERDGRYSSKNIASLADKIATLASQFSHRGTIKVGGRVIHQNARISGNESALSRILGRCPRIKMVKEQIRILSEFPGTPVLISGETGTGKELVATALHSCSHRNKGPIVRVNCAAIPYQLFESQLFGHNKGAFSGATDNRKGLAEAAGGGVLFLDEISSLRLDLQPKLLRFVEDGSYIPLGETQEKKSDAWVIAATNESLETATVQGSFRADLYHRLKSSEIELPPLRERGRDAIVLTRDFLKRHAIELNRTPKQLSQEAQNLFANYHWPGNIRELFNVTRTLANQSPGLVITESDLTKFGIRLNKTEPEREPIALDAVQKQHILKVFDQTGRQIRRTAELLKIGRNRLRRRLLDYGVLRPPTKVGPS